jgi:signal-transduction protein with cAMP-binding, CBS, and nucleotidyltransferase domain
MSSTIFLNNEIIPLNLNSTIAKAKEQFKKQIVTHLPIVKNNTLIGLIEESDIHGSLDYEQELHSVSYLFQNFSTQENTNWLNLLKIFSDNATNILPVLDINHKYLGYYELSDVLDLFNQTTFLNENGTILIVSIKKQDYSMNKIAQIVESNNTKLLGCFISNQDTNNIETTLKIENKNINEIIQTFRRYEYIIKNEIKEDSYLEELKNRSNYFKKYLSI